MFKESQESRREGLERRMNLETVTTKVRMQRNHVEPEFPPVDCSPTGLSFTLDIIHTNSTIPTCVLTLFTVTPPSSAFSLELVVHGAHNLSLRVIYLEGALAAQDHLHRYLYDLFRLSFQRTQHQVCL